MIFVSPTGRETIAGWVSERDLLSPAPRANWLANPQARTEGDTQSCLLCTFDLTGSRQRSLEGLLEQFSTMNSILRDRHPMIEPLEPTQGGQTCPIPAPYAARRTSPYGMRTHPILRYQRMHSGVDFGVDRSRGAPPIVSAMGGKVIEITDSRLGYGYQVKIQNDDGTIATYSHLDRSTRCRAVQVNQRVEKCQKIGCMGDTGLSTATHLHFEVMRKNPRTNVFEKINPETWIDFRTVCGTRYIQE